MNLSLQVITYIYPILESVGYRFLFYVMENIQTYVIKHVTLNIESQSGSSQAGSCKPHQLYFPEAVNRLCCYCSRLVLLKSLYSRLRWYEVCYTPPER